jgi:hypothetical protein
MRALIRFDHIGLRSPVVKAFLELTVHSYEQGDPTTDFTVEVHAIVPTPGLTPWDEGNGLEEPGSAIVNAVPHAVGTNPARGVAWAGAGDNPDPNAANNTTQPRFDPRPIARAVINQGRDRPGTVIQWDITSLVNDWIRGKPNEGILLRDPTTDGRFRGVRFGSREGEQYDRSRTVTGPKLVITARRPARVPLPRESSRRT